VSVKYNQKTGANKQTQAEINVNKTQPDATVCRYLFTAKSLYMFRVSQYPSSGALETVTAASGTGHNTGTATYLQCGHVGGK
jgi:stress response protein SCP2